MKAPFSLYLDSISDGIKEVIRLLNRKYDYVSVLCTDSNGFTVSVSQTANSVGHSTMMTERGFVIRVCLHGLYREYAFNHFDSSEPEKIAGEADAALEAQISLLKESGVTPYETAVLSDEPLTLRAEMETDILPEETCLDELIGHMSALSDKGMAAGEHIADCRIRAQSTHVCKMFLTKNRDLRQSYVYSECAIIPMGIMNGRTEYSCMGKSGRRGPELFYEIDGLLSEAVKNTEELLVSERIIPGEYDIITSPEVTGLIAHEAFGHGVEMDMFVKERALGKEYIKKRVGSDLVTMHEGAAADIEVSSYAFDDEGILAGDTVEIENGILKTGVCDALSALRLGILPTGNGKRENYGHKVYTRMTNTIFDSGTDTLEDMIASIESGYLLAGMRSGMEDPKHWGIQCIIERGYEISHGKLTGKIVSPIVMTGYVPDLLGSISMLSSDRELFGTGGCGKGHKEWVKVSDGGPYMKTKARLG